MRITVPPSEGPCEGLSASVLILGCAVNATVEEDTSRPLRLTSTAILMPAGSGGVAQRSSRGVEEANDAGDTRSLAAAAASPTALPKRHVYSVPQLKTVPCNRRRVPPAAGPVLGMSVETIGCAKNVNVELSASNCCPLRARLNVASPASSRGGVRASSIGLPKGAAGCDHVAATTTVSNAMETRAPPRSPSPCTTIVVLPRTEPERGSAPPSRRGGSAKRKARALEEKSRALVLISIATSFGCASAAPKKRTARTVWPAAEAPLRAPSASCQCMAGAHPGSCR